MKKRTIKKCQHKWKVEQVRDYQTAEPGTTCVLRTRTEVIVICVKCGQVKRQEI